MTALKRETRPDLSPEAALALSAFRVGVATEQRASLAAGVPYPIVDDAGQLVWVNPDGTARQTGEAQQTGKAQADR